DPSDRARAQKSSLRRLRRWRRAVGSHCLARRNLQNERHRSASLLTRRALKDRRAPSHGSDRRAAAVRLCAGGREGCGLKTPLTPFLTVGLVIWNFVSTVITDGCQTFLSARNIITQVRMPYSVHTCRTVCRNLIILAHNMVVVPLVLMIFSV